MADEESAATEQSAPPTPPDVAPEAPTTETIDTPSEPVPTAQENAEPTPAPEQSVEPPAAVIAQPLAPAPAPTPASIAPAAPANIVQELLIKARAKIQTRRRQKFDRIMEKLNRDGKITNDEVEKLLRVSDSTATRYLLALAKEGRIKRVGSRGRAVFYSKI